MCTKLLSPNVQESICLAQCLILKWRMFSQKNRIMFTNMLLEIGVCITILMLPLYGDPWSNASHLAQMYFPVRLCLLLGWAAANKSFLFNWDMYQDLGVGIPDPLYIQGNILICLETYTLGTFIRNQKRRFSSCWMHLAHILGSQLLKWGSPQ